jgi:exodeoxyribonuclease III
MRCTDVKELLHYFMKFNKSQVLSMANEGDLLTSSKSARIFAMKIVSWNVNGLRAVERKGDLEDFLKTHNPDVFLIQEIKCTENQIQPLISKYSDYKQFYHSAEKPGYAGTSIWVRRSLQFELEFELGMPDFDDTEGRIARIDIENTTILGVYFPNGGKSEEAWTGKLVFYEKFLNYVNTLRSQGKRVIFAGDVNCAHGEIDLARPKDNDGKIGFHPDERAHLDQWVENGWIDVWREFNPGVENVYSWWHVITRARARNVGWRIDYFFVDKDFLSNVKHVEYLIEQMGSDHCPVMLEIE